MSTTGRGKHPHYDAIIAWAEGRTIQYRATKNGEWKTLNRDGIFPRFNPTSEYRIKPEPAVIRYRLWLAHYKHSGFRVWVYNEDHEATAPDKSVDYFVKWVGDWQTLEVENES